MGDSNVKGAILSDDIPKSGRPPQLTRNHLSSGAAKPRLRDQVSLAVRTQHLSSHTEQAYIGWIKRFIFFYNTRHSAEMGESEIGHFLSSLATDARVKRRHQLHESVLQKT